MRCYVPMKNDEQRVHTLLENMLELDRVGEVDQPILGVDVFTLGEGLLYLAAGLTLWSMIIYLRAAWPALVGSGPRQ